MDAPLVIEILKEGLMVLLRISLPLLLVCLVLGVLVSFFQALTQIQEATLSFVPKMIGVFLGLLFGFPYMLDLLTKFTQYLFQVLIQTK
ncbi:MAG TPA: flagellar biosynthetic protein FliQ [Alphaproteobacteria bacterium]|nr:flagellar biosynthetic protein FliQ [Alphaproteobacteria bacterium]